MLERLWTALAEYEGVRALSSYRTAGEQIDGAVEVGEKLYLVEIKAGGDPTSTGDLDTFMGKPNRRPEGTLGLFVSLAGYVDNAPQLVKEYRTKSIILMSSAHLESVLAQKISLPDLIGRARNAFVGYRIVLWVARPFQYQPEGLVQHRQAGQAFAHRSAVPSRTLRVDDRQKGADREAFVR